MQTISNNPGVSTGERKARGRPRKLPGQYDHMIGAGGGLTAGRTVDPTNENFMKSEDKAGGPTDPCFGFVELVKEIYENSENPKNEKYLDTPKQHPLYEYLAKYSHSVTPMGGAADAPIPESSIANGLKTQKEVNREYNLLTESRKNMMNCD